MEKNEAPDLSSLWSTLQNECTCTITSGWNEGKLNHGGISLAEILRIIADTTIPWKHQQNANRTVRDVAFYFAKNCHRNTSNDNSLESMMLLKCIELIGCLNN